jgi:hypothetical protein
MATQNPARALKRAPVPSETPVACGASDRDGKRVDAPHDQDTRLLAKMVHDDI